MTPIICVLINKKRKLYWYYYCNFSVFFFLKYYVTKMFEQTKTELDLNKDIFVVVVAFALTIILNKHY